MGSGTLTMDSCNINNNQATGSVRARLLLETLFQRPVELWDKASTHIPHCFLASRLTLGRAG